jgi:acyl-CoA synthetase (AMP-forming)/AMP-acid ligase II
LSSRSSLFIIGNATEAELISHCQTELADHKCPKSIHFVADIPKGPTGKLLKRELAKKFA